MDTPEMQRLGPYSETQKQLQLLGRVFLGPIVRNRTHKDISDEYHATCRKLYPEYDENDLYTFWEHMSSLFAHQIGHVVFETNEHYAIQGTQGECEYNNHLADLVEIFQEKMEDYIDTLETCGDIPQNPDAARRAEIKHMRSEEQERVVVALASDLAEDFYDIILFLHAVPQPHVEIKSHDVPDERSNYVDEDGHVPLQRLRIVSKAEVPSTSIWKLTQEQLQEYTENSKEMLEYCKWWQEDKRFMDWMRDYATVMLWIGVSEGKPHVPLRVEQSARFYAMLGRNDANARVWHRGMLEKMRKDTTILKPDEALSVMEKANYDRHKHYSKFKIMHRLLSRLRETSI
jgi:hypothetical protein